MLIEGNMTGFAFFVSSAVIVLMGVVSGLPNALIMISAGVYLILVDLIWRWRKHAGYPRWWWNAEYGGRLFWLPVWMLGVIVIFINLVNALLASSA